MKLKWGNRKLTFVIIPDANSSVKRLRVPSFLIYAISTAIAGVFISAAVIYILHLQSLLANERLRTELIGVETTFDATLSGKNSTIDRLQNEVIMLASKAAQVKQQIEQLKQLDSEIKSITKSSTTLTKSTDDPSSAELGLSQGEGGTYIPASEDDIVKLSKDTGTSFDELEEQMASLEKQLALTKKQVVAHEKLMRITPNIYPTDAHQVTSEFGYRLDPLTNRPSLHAGIDFAANRGSKVFVTADGVVEVAQFDQYRGNHIVVNHSGGIRTQYMHLSKMDVKVGQKVEKGDTIGLSGSTGRSTGPHLHYEIIVNGETVNPRPYLQTDQEE